jgi:hypothetical protein
MNVKSRNTALIVMSSPYTSHLFTDFKMGLLNYAVISENKLELKMVKVKLNV